ncbi:hypothetical protein HMPREF0491_00376 [Lachnospiraceae oral taxon 107 str. F0167]|nr:hypothetical protein HMPREF0491_00376 [Lachnospiraceae oral taxon 107 str. F0167]
MLLYSLSMENNDIEKYINQGILYDFYGKLLTVHQQKIYEDVVFNDFSLSEIAENEGISRQGVSDLIKRCNKSLVSYEEKLGLIKKFDETKSYVKEIQRIIKIYQETKNEKLISDIEKLSFRILDV